MNPDDLDAPGPTGSSAPDDSGHGVRGPDAGAASAGSLAAASWPLSSPSGAGSANGRDATGAGPRDPRLHRIAEGAHAAVDRTVERVQPAVERLERELDLARGRLDAAIDSSRGLVREHPAASLATAFLVGVLLGRFRSR